VLRPRAWSPVEGVTMCTLYSLVACCGSKPQHCTLFRGKFGSVIYDTGRNRMLRLNDRGFESPDDRVQVCARAREIWAKHGWEHGWPAVPVGTAWWARLGGCYTSAQHFSLSGARRIGGPGTGPGEEVMLRPRAWSPVEGVTMCTLYSPVACCDSKPQHCTLFRGKFGSVVYGTGRNTLYRQRVANEELDQRCAQSKHDKNIFWKIDKWSVAMIKVEMMRWVDEIANRETIRKINLFEKN
jgi:hypothetical protein